jgi:phosphopantothenate-cysteine ligase
LDEHGSNFSANVRYILVDGSFCLDAGNENEAHEIAEELALYHTYAGSDSKTFASFEFESIQEYLLLLETAATELAVIGNKACFFLAAAVSDFYVPASQVSAVNPPLAAD